MAAKTQGVSDGVLKALRLYANQEVHYSDIAKDTGFTDLQVMGAISHLKRHNNINIQTPRRGWYLYKPGGGQKSVAVKAKAEVVALLEDGTVLLTIEGKLFVASELEIQ